MVKPEAESDLMMRLSDGGFVPAVIGRVTAGKGVIVRDGPGVAPLRTFEP